jgi:predicted nuclease of predicted toxin-antitoxin system
VNFLIDNSLAPLLAEKLREAGHDSVHVRRYGIHKADDEVIFERATQEDRILVSADSDFAAMLGTRQVAKPSVILIKRSAARRPEAQARLLLANRPVIAELLEQGSVIVFEGDRLRSRTLPILRGKKES